MAANRPVYHKFRAKPTEVDGTRFASKKEAQYYQGLKLRKQSGEVLFFLTQVPMRLSGGVKYVCDFVEFHADGTVHFVDVKGMKTDVYKMKKKIVEDLYPLVIEEV